MSIQISQLMLFLQHACIYMAGCGLTACWARFSGRSYAAGELEFGAFYAETGAAGTAPDDLQHGGV